MKQWMIGAIGVASAFANNEVTLVTNRSPKTEELTIIEKKYVDPEAKSKLGYVEILTGSIAHKDAEGMAVGLSLGKTFFFDNNGIDLSVNYMANKNQEYWSAPKLMWIYYHPANSTSTAAISKRSDLFFGFGASLGHTSYKSEALKRSDPWKKPGVPIGGFADFTAGYRVNFAKDMKGLIKLNVSAPFAPHFDAPVLSASFGVAY